MTVHSKLSFLDKNINTPGRPDEDSRYLVQRNLKPLLEQVILPVLSQLQPSAIGLSRNQRVYNNCLPEIKSAQSIEAHYRTC